MRNSWALFAALVLPLSSSAMTLLELMDWQLGHGLRPKLEQLNVDSPWTCLEVIDHAGEYEFDKRIVKMKFEECDGRVRLLFPFGEREEFPGGPGEGPHLKSVGEGLSLVAIRPSGHLAIKTLLKGQTYRYLCAPGHLPYSEVEGPPPEKMPLPAMQKLFERSRRPTVSELRAGEKWGCVTMAQSFKAFWESGKQWTYETKPMHAFFSLLRFDSLLVSYIGDDGRPLSFTAMDSSYHYESPRMLYQYGASFLLGTFPPKGDLLLGWSKGKQTEGAHFNWFANTIVRFDPESRSLVFHYHGEDQYGYQGRQLFQNTADGYAVCAGRRR